jgi:hypothetical protein
MKAFLTIMMAAAFLLCVHAETWAAENCFQKCNKRCEHREASCNARCSTYCMHGGH